jgi:hypothetical protein
MRKIIVLSFITLNGIMQAPGGPQEDTSGGFKCGGWTEEGQGEQNAQCATARKKDQRYREE